MKNILLVILTIFIGLQVVAQEIDCPKPAGTIEYNADNQVYTLVDIQAQPISGLESLYKIINRKFILKDTLFYKEEYHITLKFVVEKDGSFSDIKIIQDNDGIGEEAVRVLKTMSKWKPATHKGKIVRSHFTLPIKIMLD